MALSCFLLPFFCTLLATGGVINDVRDKKCDTVDPELFNYGLWKWTPVRFRGLCLRSLMQGLYWGVVAFIPTILVLWAAVQDGTISGLGYTIFKGIWAFFLALPVFTIVYFAGLDKRNFPEIEFEALMRLTSMKEGSSGPPLVGLVGHV
jgi:hypothetical protein